MKMADTQACHCAECAQTTTHIVYHERLLAPVRWCRQCFNVTIGHDREARRDAMVPRQGAPANRVGHLRPLDHPHT